MKMIDIHENTLDMSNRGIVVKRRHRDERRKGLEPEVINENPMTEDRVRDFVEETEGKETKERDPRSIELTRTSITEKEMRRQQDAMRRLKERGYKMEDED